MKLKTIRNMLEKAIKDGNEDIKQKMYSELQNRYSMEEGIDPNSSLCIQLISVMKQYNCPLTLVQRERYNAIDDDEKANSSLRNSTNAHKLGEPFTNPYSFIPFSSNPPSRKYPTPRTIDEEEERYSGILQMKVKLHSPLLSPEAKPEEHQLSKGHNSYKALTIGDSVIYPSTGVRGAMRHLMTVITGGSLRYLDNEMFLCDGRWDSKSKAEKNLQLALITEVGNRNKSGKVVLGNQRVIKLTELESRFRTYNKNVDDYRDGKVIWVKWDSDMKNPKFSFEENKKPAGYDKRLKLSGRPVGSDEKKMLKKEWVFTPDFNREIIIPPELWVEYQSRYLHGPPYTELKSDHLVWLEPSIKGQEFVISDGKEVQSIQWAKWGKEGDRLVDQVPKYVKPDYMNGTNDKVDEVSDLFGQVCPEKKYVEKAPYFAGRIRPDNAVFRNARNKLKQVTLSPLQPPHPSCKAFYRDKDLINMRGYKIYRTTKEKGDAAPHNYDKQPVFKNGRPEGKYQKVNRTVELLSSEATGELNISFTALNKREYALLRLICSLPQRFGGGKPFGLGHCSLEVTAIKNEFGKTIVDPVPDWENYVTGLKDRVDLYRASQEPVDKLRYPRAVSESRKKINRGGYIWFSLNAELKHDKNQFRSHPIKEGSELHKQIGADKLDPQPLPELTLESDGDLLFGYDLFFKEVLIKQGRHKKRKLYKAGEFDENIQQRFDHKADQNFSPNRESRQEQRRKR